MKFNRLPFLTCFCAVLSTYSQCQEAISDQFSTDGHVEAVFHDSTNNTLYVGGSFQSIARIRTKGIVLDPLTGQPSLSMPLLTGERVQASNPDGAGGFYVAGSFSINGQKDTIQIAHLNSEGVLQALPLKLKVDLYPNSAEYPYVTSMLEIDNRLYVSGYFTVVNGLRRNHVFCYDLQTNMVTSWDPNPNYMVSKLAFKDSQIYLQGDFTMLGSTARGGFAVVDLLSGKPTDLNLVTDGNIKDILLQGDTLFLGGSFKKINNVNRSYVAAIHLKSGAVLDWSIPISVDNNSYVRQLLAYNRKLYILGVFYISSPSNYIHDFAALDITSGAVVAMNSPTIPNYSSCARKDSILYFCGRLESYEGDLCGGYMALNLNTGKRQQWDAFANSYFDFPITISVSGNKIFTGGIFKSIGVRRRSIAAFDLGTGALLPLNPSPDGAVDCIAKSNDTLFLGGSFGKVAGVERPKLAAVHAITGKLLAWNMMMNNFSSDYVSNMVLYNRYLYISGTFSSIKGVSVGSSACIDFVSQEPIARGIPAGKYWIFGNTLYAGGIFTSVQGKPRSGLAAFDANTGALLDWKLPLKNTLGSLDPMVTALEIRDSIMYVGGRFYNVGPNLDERINFAAVNLKTGLPTSLVTNIKHTYDTHSIDEIRANDDAVYIVGKFNWVNKLARGSYLAVNRKTGVFKSWMMRGESLDNQYIYKLLLTKDRLVIANASSYYVDNVRRSDYLGVFSTKTPDPIISMDGAAMKANLEGTAYSWKVCGSYFSTPAVSTDRLFVPSWVDSYFVNVTDQNCTVASECVKYVVTKVDEELMDEELVKVYPNPTAERFSIELKTPVLQMTVYDEMGREVLVADNLTDLNSFSLGNEPKGLYLIKVRAYDRDYSFKLIRQ